MSILHFNLPFGVGEGLAEYTVLLCISEQGSGSYSSGRIGIHSLPQGTLLMQVMRVSYIPHMVEFTLTSPAGHLSSYALAHN